MNTIKLKTIQFKFFLIKLVQGLMVIQPSLMFSIKFCNFRRCNLIADYMGLDDTEARNNFG